MYPYPGLTPDLFFLAPGIDFRRSRRCFGCNIKLDKQICLYNSSHICSICLLLRVPLFCGFKGKPTGRASPYVFFFVFFVLFCFVWGGVPKNDTPVYQCRTQTSTTRFRLGATNRGRTRGARVVQMLSPECLNACSFEGHGLLARNKTHKIM